MNNAGTKLMTISDMSIVEAVMEVDETDMPSVKVGQTAEVRIDAFGEREVRGRRHRGRLLARSRPPPAPPTPRSTSRSRSSSRHLRTTIRPGFSCSADILTGQAPQVLAVPIQALVVREKPLPEGEAKPANPGKPVEEEGVYLFDGKEKTVRFQAVTTGMTGETHGRDDRPASPRDDDRHRPVQDAARDQGRRQARASRSPRKDAKGKKKY